MGCHSAFKGLKQVGILTFWHQKLTVVDKQRNAEKTEFPLKSIKKEMGNHSHSGSSA
jgi:hypothetical protein